jgi:hypothetical protein
MFPQQVNVDHYSKAADVRQVGILSTASRIYRTEGLKGFYRGVGIACVG